MILGFKNSLCLFLIFKSQCLFHANRTATNVRLMNVNVEMRLLSFQIQLRGFEVLKQQTFGRR